MRRDNVFIAALESWACSRLTELGDVVRCANHAACYSELQGTLTGTYRSLGSKTFQQTAHIACALQREFPCFAAFSTA